MSDIVVDQFGAAPEEWDGFVRGQPGWTHFQLYGWRGLIERVFRHECLYLAARRRDNGALEGVLPLVRVRSVTFGHYLVSMPFVNYGGPLGSRAGVDALAREAVRLAQESHLKLLELRCSAPQPIDLPASHRKVTVLLDLPPAADTLWK